MGRDGAHAAAGGIERAALASGSGLGNAAAADASGHDRMRSPMRPTPNAHGQRAARHGMRLSRLLRASGRAARALRHALPRRRNQSRVSTGCPAFFHPENPPSRWLTSSSPMSCSVLVASEERQPLAQNSTKDLPEANCGLW